MSNQSINSVEEKNMADKKTLEVNAIKAKSIKEYLEKVRQKTQANEVIDQVFILYGRLRNHQRKKYLKMCLTKLWVIQILH